MYRFQRYWYDFSRKYYLLGRDQMIAGLAPDAGDTVLEIGCGTARNLIHAARKFPDAKFWGFDLSEEMLTTAKTEIEKAGLSNRIIVRQADACSFSAQDTFGIQGFDRVFIAYSLCIIPDWKNALERALATVGDRGSLHIVDFGEQENLPIWFKHLLRGWLRQFGVFPQGNVTPELRKMAGESFEISHKSIRKGYAYLAVASHEKRN